MIDTVLFDLDGTLLPMDQEEFVKLYMGLLAKKLAGHGYEPKKLVESVWNGTKVMVKNTGANTNEAAFWEYFKTVYGEAAVQDEPVFAEFYENDFVGAKASCGFNPAAGELIAWLKAKGIKVVLATNPLFPATATLQRTQWAGLEPGDFELITTYENSSRCKPNPDYYRQVLAAVGKAPSQCVMVGNDVDEDMVAGKLGMKTFLLTDCLINRTGEDINQWPHGGFPELRAYLENTLA